MFKEISKNNSFILKLGKYKEFNTISKIPSTATFEAEQTKFKCVCTLNKSSLLSNPEIQKLIRQSKNDSESSGQD